MQPKSNKNQDLAQIFSLFHDGYIENAQVKNLDIDLKVGIQYLSMLINKKHEFLHLTLLNVELFIFDAWADEPFRITDCEKINELSPEIMDAKVNENGEILVTTLIHNTPSNTIKGGFLIIKCLDYKLSDEEKNEISIETLKELASYYWQVKIKEYPKNYPTLLNSKIGD